MRLLKAPVNVKENIKAMEQLIVEYRKYTHKTTYTGCSLCKVSNLKCDSCPWISIKGHRCNRYEGLPTVAEYAILRLPIIRTIRFYVFGKAVRKRIAELKLWIMMYKAFAVVGYDLAAYNSQCCTANIPLYAAIYDKNEAQ